MGTEDGGRRGIGERQEEHIHTHWRAVGGGIADGNPSYWQMEGEKLPGGKEKEKTLMIVLLILVEEEEGNQKKQLNDKAFPRRARGGAK